MSKQKWSDSPWVTVFGTNNGFEIRGTLGQPVAIEPWHGGPEHKQYEDLFKATANLLASAPELYEALADVLAILDERDANGCDVLARNECSRVAKANAALKKARGEA